MRGGFDDGRSSMTHQSHICGSWIFFAPDDFNCDTCSGFMNTVATIFHECDYANGTNHPLTYCNEAPFLRTKVLPSCAAGTGPCATRADCEAAVQTHIDIAQQECDNGNTDAGHQTYNSQHVLFAILDRCGATVVSTNDYAPCVRCRRRTPWVAIVAATDVSLAPKHTNKCVNVVYSFMARMAGV
jgi:hypothetical protein